MNLGGRQIGTVVRALGEARHYRALLGAVRHCAAPIAFLGRYLTGGGSYPFTVGIRTPTGPIRVTMQHHHDLLTVNEVFFREDYPVPPDVRVVVDIGANRGYSALYFLTRNPAVRCYLFEPVPENLSLLREALASHRERVVVSEAAIHTTAGERRFGVEPTGRYGGLGVASGREITVSCLEVNAALGGVLAREGFIDLVKIDTEGTEIELVRALRPELLRRISRLYLEARPEAPLWPALFRETQAGSVCRLSRHGLREA